MTHRNDHTDVAIIGGGPVGTAAALALAGSGLAVTLLEAHGTHGTPGAHGNGARPIAVSHGSRLLLEHLGAWQGLHGTPIREVHVSQRGGFGRVAMQAADLGVPALAQVVDYAALAAALRGALDTATTRTATIIDGARVTAINRDGADSCLIYSCDDATHTLHARLAVLADGGDIAGLASPRTLDYGQSAVTACVRTQRPHHGTAYERFTPEGPLALLPFGGDDASALVWTVPAARAASLMPLEDGDFLRALTTAFGHRLGAFTAVTQRAVFPLSLRYHARVPAPGVIAIGNAAQTLHPVAGQGFNLGLRDAWELAALLRTHRDHHARDSGMDALALARDFHARRRLDRGATITATHSLVQLFSNEALSFARGAGMTLFAALPPLKNFFARRMALGWAAGLRR